MLRSLHEAPGLGPRRVHAGACCLLLLAVSLVSGMLAGCGKSYRGFFGPNTPPSVTLTSGPVDTLTDSLSWIVDIAWTANDPDGRVDHFEYTVDPPTMKQAALAQSETLWVSTTENRVTIRFRASRANTLGPGGTSNDFHVFALRAFDDRGGVSPLLVRAFYAYTVAPDLAILSPIPNRLLQVVVPAPFRVSWAGDDPDGAGSRAPESYRMRLLDLDDPENTVYLFDPDSLRRIAVATDWADWRRIGGDTTSLVLDDLALVANSHWLLALVAVDEAGAVTPYMSLDQNLLRFTVGSAGLTIHVFSPYLDFTSAPNTFVSVPVEAPAGRVLTFRWDALPPPGRRIVGTRWLLDGDISDETPRTDEATDWSHWSRFVLGIGTATFGPLAAGAHTLYIDARDDFGGRGLVWLRITCVDVPLDRELLVVDDTRLEADKFGVTGCPFVYTQPWPSAAELDTFLYARGGVPWRCARDPAGALSPAGLLAGFKFDTLGTRLGLEDPAAAVTLFRLGQYRHVLWLVDGLSATYGAGQGSTFGPITALRAMSAPGRISTLASYVSAGGQVWLAGGGAAYASLINFNRTDNDGAGVLFTFDDGELGPGRPMYDHAHVRSALGVGNSSAEPQRSLAARGGWSGHGPLGTLSAPDYSRLPVAMRFKTPDTDPIPPTRLANQGGLYYRSNTRNEYVAAPNEITEDMDPDPAVARIESTLDTLYEVNSTLLLTSPAPVMLYYHGRDNVPFVFTGFDLWSWTRDDCQALVDFVLVDLWGLNRTGPSTAAARATGGPRGARRPGPRSDGWHRLDPPRARP